MHQSTLMSSQFHVRFSSYYSFLHFCRNSSEWGLEVQRFPPKWPDFSIWLLLSLWSKFGDKQDLIYTSSSPPPPPTSSFTQQEQLHLMTDRPCHLQNSCCAALLSAFQHPIWRSNFKKGLLPMNLHSHDKAQLYRYALWHHERVQK